MVKLQRLLGEDQNTDCDSMLECYCCMVSVKDTEPIFLFVDLIKGITDSLSGIRV